MPVLSINADGDSKLKLLATLFKRFWSINPGQLALCFQSTPGSLFPGNSKAKDRLCASVARCPDCSRRDRVPQRPSCILSSTQQIKHLYNIQAGGRNVNSTLRKAVINM